MKSIDEDDEIRIIGGANWKGNNEESSDRITIKEMPAEISTKHKHSRKLRWIILFVLILLVAVIGVLWGYQSYRYRFAYPISRTQSEVIKALEKPARKVSPGIELTVDTILGVPMKFYKISGLKAEMVNGIPDTENPNVYLATRSADYRYDNDKKKIIGDYIIDGKLISRSSWRGGYFVILDGKVQIGVGRTPKMRDYIIKHKGSMFRQFALVSSGVKCVSQYVLKGKVSRCAYARMPNNELYFVETIHRETLYGFSDALAEYGFVDAVYITGGAQPDLFYRDKNGVKHGKYVDDKAHSIIVWKKN